MTNSYSSAPCPRCGAEARSTDQRGGGGLDRYICPSCSHEFVLEKLHPPPSMPESRTPPRRELYATWKANKPSVTELAALRAMFARFRDMSLTELKSGVTSRVLILGEYSQYDADALIERARTLGLTIRQR